MKTFVISAVIATMASTASFAAVGDTVSNGYGKTLEVVSQSTGSSGNTQVILLNDAGQERKFTVKPNGKVKGKGGKRLKRNVRDMVEEDARVAALGDTSNAGPDNTTALLESGAGKGMFLYDCSFNYNIDRIVEIEHGLPSFEIEQMDNKCAA